MHLRRSRQIGPGAARAMLVAILAASMPATAAQAGARIADPGQMVRAQGARWVTADGKPIVLRGANLGNWLINEFWMMGQGSNGIDDQCKLEAALDRRFGYPERERLMKLFRDNWMTGQDWDRLAAFGVNLVRIPFIHTVVEDEKKPGTLRADAWHYLDWAIEQAERRGIYVILDLHGAAGSQGWEHHSGCAGRNQYWSVPEYQQRTVWLWQQVAGRYRDRPSVAGYSLLNEPWGTDSANMAAVVETLYQAVRAVDPNHVIILPGHVKDDIQAYGKPSDKGMRNVAFEMHPYPGHFGWSTAGREVHRAWLRCEPGGPNTVCEWDRRIQALDTPFYLGEIQPWASMGLELGGQVARASFDTYAKLGWAATAWSYKYVSNKGGHGQGTWGMVTNAEGALVPPLDFHTASKTRIEALFRLFGTLRYEPHGPLQRWMTSATPPGPFAPGAE
ncbi:cellulase family glycosylhydrolase [Massilia sp. IC2-477]|uniref:glycoside hydrolase family 5 protein n=1 Tax=Massilia sp. IC2-477 TaxID=2887198 RepID=UPI001D11BAF5|nr:cellulase family glycosylhydrolase [Massilia sp. IC2-477]MCC2956722.1 cellulase family glycosylhydrolase [Massilia sp. IC2-477]